MKALEARARLRKALAAMPETAAIERSDMRLALEHLEDVLEHGGPAEWHLAAEACDKLARQHERRDWIVVVRVPMPGGGWSAPYVPHTWTLIVRDCTELQAKCVPVQGDVISCVPSDQQVTKG